MKNSTLEVPRRRRRSWSSDAERKEWIRAWEMSGQTQAAFAADRGLSVTTLRNWLRRHRCPPVAAVPLKEISLAEVLGPLRPREVVIGSSRSACPVASW